MSNQPIYDDDVSGDLTGSFLRQSDFEGGEITFIIERVEKAAFEAKNGRPAETKWVLTFPGDRRFGLNKTNLALLAKWYGKRPSAWTGQPVTVYLDESITFGGRLVGGLRVRRPARTTASVPVTDFTEAPKGGNDVPF